MPTKKRPRRIKPDDTRPWYCSMQDCVTGDCAAYGDPERCPYRVKRTGEPYHAV